MKPRLRWNGLIWARTDRLADALRYWHVLYRTDQSWGVEGRFYADRCSELLPV